MSTTRSVKAEKPNLTGLRILVVEDEYYIANDICQILQDCGAQIVGPAPSLAKALPLAEDEPLTCAVLDINLRGESGLEIAEVLNRRSVPFVFATGYRISAVDPLKGAARLEKPFRLEALLDAVAKIAQRSPIP